jgi:hypothetical protein
VGIDGSFRQSLLKMMKVGPIVSMGQRSNIKS